MAPLDEYSSGHCVHDKRWLTRTLCLVVLGAIVVSACAEAPNRLATASAEVGPEDMLLDGVMTWPPSLTLGTDANGIVTSAAVPGSVVQFGDELYRINDAPTVLLPGTTPAFRDLAPGVEGSDVRQLEEYLGRLGLTDEYDVTIDDRFTSSTLRAVRAWQRDRGWPETRSLRLSSLVFSDSPMRVLSSLVGLGGSAAPGVLEAVPDRLVAVAVIDARTAALIGLGGRVELSLIDGSRVEGSVSTVEAVRGAEGITWELTVTADEPTSAWLVDSEVLLGLEPPPHTD